MSSKPWEYEIDEPAHPTSGNRESSISAENESMAHYVRGERSSKEEYWLSKAWDKLQDEGSVLSWIFQPSYFTLANVPGEVRLDFMVNIPPSLPVYVDGLWIHKSAEAQSRDKLNDARLNERLQREGAMPVVRIPTDPWLITEEITLQTARMAIAGEQFV